MECVRRTENGERRTEKGERFCDSTESLNKRRHSEGGEADRRIPCLARAKKVKFTKKRILTNSVFRFPFSVTAVILRERMRPKNPPHGERVESSNLAKSKFLNSAFR